jgi:hypothetical protein
MQIIRTVWQNAFYVGNYYPAGYYRCKWDSLAWSWEINIRNGKFIYFTDNFYHINADREQKTWDSTCTQCRESDSIPKFPNKEDLSVFGYKNGAPDMDTITAKNWEKVMRDPIQGDYVRKVRGSKYAKPW